MSGVELSYQKTKRRKRYRKALKRAEKQEVLNLIDSKMTAVLEKKHNDVVTDLGVLGSSWTQNIDLTPISQGTLDTQRIGDTIDLVSIQGRYTLSCVDDTNIIRVSVVQWNEDSSVSGNAEYSKILQFASTPATDLMSPLELDKNQRYRVLWDKLFFMKLDGDTTKHIFEFYINKGFRKQIQYGNNVTTGIGKIYLLFESDSVLAGHPTIQGISRVRYYDA